METDDPQPSLWKRAHVLIPRLRRPHRRLPARSPIFELLPGWARVLTNVLIVGLVVAVTGLAYAISYVSLQHLAAVKAGNWPWWATWAWPACLDVAALVAALIAWRDYQTGNRNHYAELWMIVWSGLTVAGNAVPAEQIPTWTVHALPAATMLGAWHMVIRRKVKADLPAPAASPDVTGDTRSHDRSSTRPGTRVMTRRGQVRASSLDQVIALMTRLGHDQVTKAAVMAEVGVRERQATRLLRQAHARLQPPLHVVEQQRDA